MARSLNKVLLIGNLTRDPELRYTPQGTAVATFSIATNRQWKSESGEAKEDVEFHRLVVWDKLAEICAQMLKKGRKIYVEGRLQTRTWQAQDGAQKSTTEIVVTDMVMLDSKRESSDGSEMPEEQSTPAKTVKPKAKEEMSEEKGTPEEEVNVDDIPF